MTLYIIVLLITDLLSGSNIMYYCVNLRVILEWDGSKKLVLWRYMSWRHAMKTLDTSKIAITLIKDDAIFNMLGIPLTGSQAYTRSRESASLTQCCAQWREVTKRFGLRRIDCGGNRWASPTPRMRTSNNDVFHFRACMHNAEISQKYSSSGSEPSLHSPKVERA